MVVKSRFESWIGNPYLWSWIARFSNKWKEHYKSYITRNIFLKQKRNDNLLNKMCVNSFTLVVLSHLISQSRKIKHIFLCYLILLMTQYLVKYIKAIFKLVKLLDLLVLIQSIDLPWYWYHHCHSWCLWHSCFHSPFSFFVKIYFIICCKGNHRRMICINS